MKNKVSPRITAIVPAFNEEKNLANILQSLTASLLFEQIIVVDDGSTDQTATVANGFAVKLIRMPSNVGKGLAVDEAVKQAKGEIILLLDADITGITNKHLKSLVAPIILNQVGMVIGCRDRFCFRHLVGRKILCNICGERALKRSLWNQIPISFKKGYLLETMLNGYCRVNDIPTLVIPLRGVKQVIKEKKWGLLLGMRQRLKMIYHIISAHIILWSNPRQHLPSLIQQ